MSSVKPNLTVMKFGGSCLVSSASFQKTTGIIKRYLSKSKIVIVASALQGITDKLLNFYSKSCDQASECDLIIENVYNIHKTVIDEIFDPNKIEYQHALDFLDDNIDELSQLGKIIRLLRPSKDIRDIIASYGEKLSTYILSEYLISVASLQSQFISSEEIIVTDENFGNALPLLEDTEDLVSKKILPLLDSNKLDVVCVTGYYGSTKDKKITTLGRGASDLTASILAYCLQPKYNTKVIFWKDVKGFLNADPKIYEKASLLKQISYVEAKELAFFGSKVLHPLCLDVNEKRNIPSEIRPFNEPESDEFTAIGKEFVKEEKIIKAITSIEKLSMVTVESGTMISLPGTASKLFSLLGDNNINIKFISQSSSENNITFGIDMEDSTKASVVLRNSDMFGKQWFSIKIDNDISLIAVIGSGMLHSPGIAGRVFTTLGNSDINVRAIAQGSSELNITIVVERQDYKKAVKVLFDEFIANNNNK